MGGWVLGTEMDTEEDLECLRRLAELSKSAWVDGGCRPLPPGPGSQEGRPGLKQWARDAQRDGV